MKKKSKLRNCSLSLALLKLFFWGKRKKKSVPLFLFAKHANGFPSVSVVKIPPAKQEMQYPCVESLGQKNPL